MFQRIRGRAVIINNMYFGDPEKVRKGSEKDVEALTKLFECLHFEVHLRPNQTAQVIFLLSVFFFREGLH